MREKARSSVSERNNQFTAQENWPEGTFDKKGNTSLASNANLVCADWKKESGMHVVWLKQESSYRWKENERDESGGSGGQTEADREPLQIAAGKYRDGNEDSAGQRRRAKASQPLRVARGSRGIWRWPKARDRGEEKGKKAKATLRGNRGRGGEMGLVVPVEQRLLVSAVVSNLPD